MPMHSFDLVIKIELRPMLNTQDLLLKIAESKYFSGPY